MTSNDKIRWIYKPIVWVVLLMPIAWLGWLLVNKNLTANPTEFINQYLGVWGIRILWITLAVTPIASISGWKSLIRFRRLTGLFAFFYVFLHVTRYVMVDQNFDWAAIYNDIVKRFYITIGVAAFIILIILAATSPAVIVKLLGSRAWKRVHQAVYIGGLLAATHFIMMRKGLQAEPIIYAVILIVLLGARLGFYLKKRLKINKHISR